MATFDTAKHINKRTPSQRASDLVFISSRLVQGMTGRQITEELNASRDYHLTSQQIYYDIKKINDEWVRHYLQDISTMKARELARIDRLEKEAWEAWERSKKPLSVTEKEQIENEQSNQKDTYQRHKKVRAKKVETERDGEKKFFDTIQWCIEQRCKILGVNAAQKLDISWKKQAEAEGIDAEEVKEQLVQQFLEAAQKGVKS